MLGNAGKRVIISSFQSTTLHGSHPYSSLTREWIAMLAKSLRHSF